MIRRFAVPLTLLACVFVFASSGNAGIGNPIKKAKEKLQQKVAPDQAPQGDDVVFDNVTVELTEERVSKITAAFQKAKAEGTARQELQAQYDKKQNERSDIANKNEEQIRKANEKRDAATACYQQGYRELADRKAREYAQKAMTMDPQLLAKNAKIAAENNAAAARGDSAAIARGQNALNAEILPSKEDSAGVRKSCGPLPPKSAAELRIEQLDKEMAALGDQMRAMDEKIAKAQAKAGGLTEQQYSVAMERIQMYDAATRSSKDSGGGGRTKKGEKSESGGETGNGKASAEGGDPDAKVIYVKGYTQPELKVLAKYRAALRAALQ